MSNKTARIGKYISEKGKFSGGREGRFKSAEKIRNTMRPKVAKNFLTILPVFCVSLYLNKIVMYMYIMIVTVFWM